MKKEELDFINSLTGADLQQTLAAVAERDNARRGAFELARSALAGQKQSIRTLTDVQLVDGDGKEHQKSRSSKGQEEALDTFKATGQGRGLSKDDMKLAGEALRKISEATAIIVEQRTPDGKPLFDTQAEFEAAMAQEIFSPLVREGVLPENFVINKFSEVQQLLDATFKSYKKRSADGRDEAEEKKAEAATKRTGASGKWEQIKSGAKYVAAAPGLAVEGVLDDIGIDEKARRRVGIAVQGAKAAVSVAQASATLAAWAPDASGKPKIVGRMQTQLDPSRASIFQGPNAPAVPANPDDARVMVAHAKMTERVAGLGLTAGAQEAILGALFLRDETGWVATFDWTKDYADTLKTIVKDLGIQGYDAVQLKGLMDTVGHETANVAAATKAAAAIDAALVALLDAQVRSGVGAALAGKYTRAVNTAAVSKAAGQAKVDDQELIDEYALAFEQVFAGDIDASLAGEGKALADSFRSKAPGKALQKALKTEPSTAFMPLVEAAKAAIAETLKGIGPAKLALIDTGAMKGTVAGVVQKIDEALSKAVRAKAGAAAAEALTGLYACSVNVSGAAAAAARAQPDGTAIVRALASGFVVAFAKAAPASADTAFVAAGKAIAAALEAKVDATRLAAAVAANDKSGFDAVVANASSAIDAGLKGADALISALKNPETQRAIAGKSAMPDPEAAMAAMEAAADDLEAYERQLVLIDEGGVAAAEMQTIDKLIAEIERDRAIAEMIIAAADAFTSLGINTTNIVGWTTAEVTDTLVGEIAGPLKAAKLIVQFGVAMKQANDRRILFVKIKKNLGRSKNAVSPLQSTIQGLFNNKVEQISFHAVEDALTLVQIAAAILGSIPEPYSMAVGKSVGAVATALEATRKVTEMAFNEHMLSKAWTTTLAAIRNPQDRATGLKALRLNPTLGMHAIAWAGMERQPPEPVARMLLADLGLNEQTLMVSGTEDKVREYLEARLFEDRSLVDADLVAPKWVPASVKLSIEDWAVCVARAQRDAEPPLRPGAENTVLEALKPVGRHDLAALKLRAKTGMIEEAEMARLLAETGQLSSALRAYAPKTADGSDHDEMENLAANFLKMATDHERDLRDLSFTNLDTQARDVKRVNARLQAQAAAVDQAAEADSFGAVTRGLDAACDQIREVQIVGLDTDPAVKPAFDALMKKTDALAKALGEMASWQGDMPDWKGDLVANWEAARKQAGLKVSTNLSVRLKEAQAALKEADANPAKKPAAVATLQKVVDNIDTQLGAKPAPGLALYLRQMKSGAKARMA